MDVTWEVVIIEVDSVVAKVDFSAVVDSGFVHKILVVFEALNVDCLKRLFSFAQRFLADFAEHVNHANKIEVSVLQLFKPSVGQAFPQEVSPSLASYHSTIY
jgi:hypothetical protein